MNFFQSLFCNQYAAISGKGGNARTAQVYTIIVSAGLITLYLLIIPVVYARFSPHQPAADLVNNKAAGKFLACGISLVVFFTLRFLIGSKEWYDKTVEQYSGMTDGEQRRTVKKGSRYLFIASLPVIVFILWLLASLF